MRNTGSALAAAAAALAFVTLGGATDVRAQDRSWVPWYEIGVPKASPPRARGGRTIRSDDDDDATPRGGQFGYQRSQVKFPPLLQGGPRPDISAQAPQTVAFNAGYGQGSIVIDTNSRSLYYVLGGGQAYRYPISVGREGFTWRGTEKISRVAAWPDWRPPQEMRERDPRLPELMTGGLNNPLGAKALYLGNSLYRIHGTNDSKSIGYAASSGCFRMMNAHVIHLSGLAGVGTTVHVLDRLPNRYADSPQTQVPPRVRKAG
jgi:lipoprotein-anchoring transpeptidase ErfK/SrfK